MDRWRMNYDQYLAAPETVLQDMIAVMNCEAEVHEEMRLAAPRTAR